MDNRLSGLVIVITALLFLWLYDTGRWGAIGAIIRGANSNAGLPPGTATPNAGGPTITPSYPWPLSLIPGLGSYQPAGAGAPQITLAGYGGIPYASPGIAPGGYYYPQQLSPYGYTNPYTYNPVAPYNLNVGGTMINPYGLGAIGNTAINVSNPQFQAAIGSAFGPPGAIAVGAANLAKNLWNDTIGSILPIHF